MYLLQPVSAPDLTDFEELPLFFFIGPVRGGGDWQAEMWDAFARQCTEFIAAIPTRYTPEHRLMRYLMPKSVRAFEYGRQLQWERHFIDRAARASVRKRGCVIAWLGEQREERPPDQGPYAQDTYGELGELRGRMMCGQQLRVVIGAEPRFPGLDTIRRNFKHGLSKPHFIIHESMDEVARIAISIAIKGQ